jgi:hypothetical protein
MSDKETFPFHNARRISPAEVLKAKKAIEQISGTKRTRPGPGRPRKSSAEKYVPISIRLHPAALKWLKKESKKLSVPYQTVINQLLLLKAL